MILPTRTTLIAGPPCSGKTHLADSLAEPGDVVLDFDVIARDLGSPAQWLHPEPFRSQAEARMRELLDQLPGQGPGRAYVIRAAPTARARAITVRSIRADQCIVLDPGPTVCHERAARDGRPEGTHEQIDQWYAAWSRWSGDEQGPHEALSIFAR